MEGLYKSASKLILWSILLLSWQSTPGEMKSSIKLALVGDVMTGRGIDQIMPHPGDPQLYESYMKSASGYVDLVERKSGRIDKPVTYDYIWGDALVEIKRSLVIINLETSITTSDDYWPRKGINYRMNPQNMDCLIDAGIDVATLANNHILDWGYNGLEETLTTLDGAGIKTAGVGHNMDEASAPAVVPIPGGSRLLVFGLGHRSSGIPPAWSAGRRQAGINRFGFSDKPRDLIATRYLRHNDIVVASIHWGSNWGYEIHESQITFAHKLIDEADVDIVHGHSSHHVKGLEIYRGKLIIYGSGDFINDYEGIGGHEEYRSDLVLLYLPTLSSASGNLKELRLIPFKSERFRLIHATRNDAAWLYNVLNREGERFGSAFHLNQDSSLSLRMD